MIGTRRPQAADTTAIPVAITTGRITIDPLTNSYPLVPSAFSVVNFVRVLCVLSSLCPLCSLWLAFSVSSVVYLFSVFSVVSLPRALCGLLPLAPALGERASATSPEPRHKGPWERLATLDPAGSPKRNWGRDHNAR